MPFDNEDYIERLDRIIDEKEFLIMDLNKEIKELKCQLKDKQAWIEKIERIVDRLEEELFDLKYKES